MTADESIADRIERLGASILIAGHLRRRRRPRRLDKPRRVSRGRGLDCGSIELDRCWDLLCQRRALRGAGADPDRAQVRDSKTVEGYQR